MDLKLEVLRKEVKQFRKNSPRVLIRLLALIALTKYRHKHGSVKELDYEQIAGRFDRGGRTLYRWEASYKSLGVQGLIPLKAPGRKPRSIRGHTAKKIREMRKYFNWGAEVIQAHLELDHNIKISLYRIHQFLLKKGFIFTKKRKLRKVHTQVVLVEHPGQHTQTDVKHLPHLLGDGKKCYNYNFVDHASKWSFKKAYDSYGPCETKDFISSVVAAAPFTIRRLQSDNGVEFTNKYISKLDDPKIHALDVFCTSHEIRHVLIPPGEKELQGLVERSHRQDDEELFHRIKPYNLAEFNKILSQHMLWRNSKRRRKALGWKSSDEFLADYAQKVKNWLYENAVSPFEIQATNETTEECVSSDKKAA
jgi:transposase